MDEHSERSRSPVAVDRQAGPGRLASLGRFALVHVLAYALVGAAFLALLDAVPAPDRAALEFFDPYRPPGVAVLAAQAARAGVLALVLAPFYDRFVGRDRGWLVLAGVLWGLTVVGSIEPMPGSIEGLIYTETSLLAHGVVLVATALQAALFARAFAWWESRAGVAETGTTTTADGPGARATAAFVGRFSLVLAAVYLAAGLAFFALQDYATVLATREAFALYRPLDHPLVQGAALLQFVRGTLLALFMLPLYPGIFGHDRGWLRLFGVLWGLTFLGAPNAVYGLATDLVAAGSLSGVLFGTAEVTVQLAVLSVLLWAWERRAVVRRA